MQLTKSDCDNFNLRGWLLVKNLFSPEEINFLMNDVPRIFKLNREEVVREKDGKTPRTAFGAQYYSEPFSRLARHPRLIEPAKQLIDGQIYLHQFKINSKAAFNGDVWQWHQDFGTWNRDDGMPDSRALNIALFLEDVTEFNGPLMLIPSSHREGILGAGHDETTTSYPLWTLDTKTIDYLARKNGMIAPTGVAGSALFFHSNLVHGSSANMSPWGRTIVYISACHVDNHIQKFNRPEWLANRDFSPVKCLPNDCLL